MEINFNELENVVSQIEEQNKKNESIVEQVINEIYRIQNLMLDYAEKRLPDFVKLGNLYKKIKDNNVSLDIPCFYVDFTDSFTLDDEDYQKYSSFCNKQYSDKKCMGLLTEPDHPCKDFFCYEIYPAGYPSGCGLYLKTKWDKDTEYRISTNLNSKKLELFTKYKLFKDDSFYTQQIDDNLLRYVNIIKNALSNQRKYTPIEPSKQDKIVTVSVKVKDDVDTEKVEKMVKDYLKENL